MKRYWVKQDESINNHPQVYWEAWLLPFLLVARRERSPRPGARASPVTSTRSDVRVKPWIWQAGMRLPSCCKLHLYSSRKQSCWGKAVTLLLNKLKVNWHREAYSKSKFFHFISISGLKIMKAKSLQNPLFGLYSKNILRELLAWGVFVFLCDHGD